MNDIPASHVNFIHLLLKEVAREATHGRILAIRNTCGSEIEQRFAIIERNVDALRGLLPNDESGVGESVVAQDTWADDKAVRHADRDDLISTRRYAPL